MPSHDIILVNPPYSTMGNPYISVPLLHSYLKNENIDVASFDLDALLYKDMSKPETVRSGIEHVKQRFIELNEQESLTFAESLEYKMFSILLFQLSLHGKTLTDFTERDYTYDEFKNTEFKKLLITASSAQSFPEMIVTVPQFAVNPLYDSFSVSGIFDSLSDNNLILDTLYRTIDSILETSDAPVWGFSVPFIDQLIKAFQCAAYIKKKKPDTFIIMGGPSISMYFKNLQNQRLFSIVDAFAYHEGELTLKSLVNVIKTGGSLHDVPGIAFKDAGGISFTIPPGKIKVNDSAIPDYQAMGLDSYIKGRESMMVPIRLTKGCAWGKCSFCSSYNSEYEEINHETALNHLLKTYTDTGIRNYIFSDESSPLDILDYLAEKIIEMGLSVSWIFHTRLSKKLTRDRLELYLRAGCIRICIGIESTWDRILKKMNKGITFAQIDSFFDEIEPGFPVGAYMMIGFPGEREDEAKASFNYLSRQIKNKKLSFCTYSQFTVKPESAIWDTPEEFGITNLNIKKERDLDHNIHSFQSGGMSVEKIYELFRLFSGNIKLENAFSKINRINFQDISAELNFSMKDVIDFIATDTSFFYKSNMEWFSNPATISRSEKISW